MSQRLRKCKHLTCDIQTRSPAGFCVEHTFSHRSCAVNGCENMVMAYNRSGCCKHHRAESRKLRP